MAALQAANSEHDLILLESNESIGRKLLTTGSGRCNITNSNLQSSDYSCKNTGFVQEILNVFSPQKFCVYLEQLGIPVYSTPDGWTYPISNSAANVVDILKAHLDQAGVKILFGKKVSGIKTKNNQFQLKLNNGQENLIADNLLVATGGMAYPTLGSTGELFPILESLGHKIHPIYPALAPITTEMKMIHKLQGVRQDVQVILYENEEGITKNSGNVIFTNWGINGPGVMDISHFIGKKPEGRFYLTINFLYPYEGKLQVLFKKNQKNDLPLSILLESLISKKIIQMIYQTMGFSEETKLRNLDENKIKHLFNLLTEFRLDVKGTRGFEFSQASGGGIDPGEVDPKTMQSKIIKNLYFAGEILDIVGPCGGYNLHWAFASGYVAGSSISPQK